MAIEFRYDYTIDPNNSTPKFKEACKKIEENVMGLRKDKLLLDVDGSTIQPYSKDGEYTVVYDDYDVGAVYVKSEFDLGNIFD